MCVLYDSGTGNKKVPCAGQPNFNAGMSAKVKTWVDTQARRCSLAGKIGDAFATVNYLHAGGDIGIENIQKPVFTSA